MKKTAQLVLALAALMAASQAQARNDVLTLPLEEVVRMGMEQGKLDGSVKFYLSGAATPKVSARLGEDISNKKTNGVGKDDAYGCKWAALSALIAFQESAKQNGANAVVEPDLVRGQRGRGPARRARRRVSLAQAQPGG